MNLGSATGRDAERTCVLVRHYREQWKSVRAIRITGDNIRTFWGPTALNTFVTCLLLFRNKLPLDEAELNTYEEMTPLFESMPFLVDAFVRLGNSDDYCQNSYEAGDSGDESCTRYCGINYGKSTCVLEALSTATKLELIASPVVFIFRRDLAQCPMFSKLKTLLLNEWCLTANLGALICFLQHSPILENLILQFHPNQYNLVEMGASYNLKKHSLILKNLTLEVKCAQVDDRIIRILEVFHSCGLPLEKIKIKHLPTLSDNQFPETWASGSFSFEQKT
ncbi:hypothetical protein QOZ80_3AG0247150 [Eleusine coracana subsp. coracana]|nr:hypothetical protein QOZ80_3AG0247150 [Eleusine coracana subsp. coracana]